LFSSRVAIAVGLNWFAPAFADMHIVIFGQRSIRSCAFPDTRFAFSDKRLAIGAQFAQHQ